MRQGKVYLVGAGPGDPGLISVKGLDCIRRADVIVYDHLIDESLLRNAPASAELIYAGKSSSTHAMEQDDINRLLVTRAREGRAVVRLKGADPLVLGRGGEEAQALAEAGLSFEIVPGISSAIGAPAYAGIPVTHRKVASSFAVITGHEDPTKETTSINWANLSTGVDTLIFLMGMANLPKIVDRLTEHGRSASTPVALIRNGTTLRQETLEGTLGDIAARAQEAGFKPPVVIVVGEVVKLRGELAWFEKRPLFGRRIVVTRSRTQASVLSQMLAERGAEAIEVPTIAIEQLKDTGDLDNAVRSLSSYDWIVFTSVNGVDAVWERIRAVSRDARTFAGTRICAIGPATAEALEEHGLSPELVPATYTSEDILSALADAGVAGCAVLLPRADIAPGDLLDGLVSLGARPHHVTAYRTVIPEAGRLAVPEVLSHGQIDMFTFTSSSTVTNLRSIMGQDWERIRQSRIACIGPRTAATATELGLVPDIVAVNHTMPGLVEAIEQYYQREHMHEQETI